MLRSLKVRHFRCFETHEVEFTSGLNFIVGPNARGKTSLLEAACILLRLQSPRVTRLAAVIQHGKRGFVVDGHLDDRHLQFYFGKERKKLAIDSVTQNQSHEYLQLGRVMWFSNTDIDLARGGADVRRRFLDFVCTQREPGYRSVLREYERALRSRNLLLKQASPRWREVFAFDQPLIDSGTRLTEARTRLADDLSSPANEAHRKISDSRETLTIQYHHGATDDFTRSLATARKEDARLRQTTIGPHRDDLLLSLNGHSADLASEGQQRSLVLALRLAAARLLAAHFQTPPVLLIDDIFGELDPARRNAFLAGLPEDSQKIVTTTHLNWMEGEPSRVLRL